MKEEPSYQHQHYTDARLYIFISLYLLYQSNGTWSHASETSIEIKQLDQHQCLHKCYVDIKLLNVLTLNNNIFFNSRHTMSVIFK